MKLAKANLILVETNSTNKQKSKAFDLAFLYVTEN